MFTAQRGRYGAKRITALLKDDPSESQVNHKRDTRTKRSLKLFDYSNKCQVTATVSDKTKMVFPDLADYKFTAEKPNQTSVENISYLPVADGSTMHLARVLGRYCGQLVGFVIADLMRTSLVRDALRMAKGQRASLIETIFLSDQANVDTSHAS